MPKKQQNKAANITLKPIEISVDLPKKGTTSSSGVKISRLFTQTGQDIFNSVNWDKRASLITDEKGNVISQITDIETPSDWSQLATDIAAYKYFRKAGVPTKEGRETSVRQLVYRVTRSISDFGEKFGYFASRKDRQSFEDELTFILLTQRAAFNSPVWFNVGLYHQYGIKGQEGGSFYWDFSKEAVTESKAAYRNPQCSACFILSLKDSLASIYETLATESRIFKFGSGAGANFSRLRSRFERLSGGGLSSGMMSFLRVFDRSADSVKSGGTTRRAAKMVVVDISHPEIEDFIEWKVREEQKAQALIAAGYGADFNGEAYHTVSGQNANNSVRVTDEFMRAVEQDGEWTTRTVTTNEPIKTYKARQLMDRIAKAAWRCADPGLQFDTTINEWHTCANTDRIYASNPCSEYMFLDDTACNLASVNLVKFADERGNLDIKSFRHACRVMIIAQEILVDFSSYPTKRIAERSHEFRTLGLGYANLGTLLMIRGVPYDSDEGRSIAAAITAIMCGHAYKTSAELAAVKGPFPGFVANRSPMLNVMNKHRAAAYKLGEKKCPKDLLEAAQQDWNEAVALGEQFGYRNAQTTVIAPTGTIGLLMDCDTTGIEPDFALVKFKKLAGGGSIKIVNNSVKQALKNLGYSDQEQQEIIVYALGTATLQSSCPVNREALKKKGLSDQELDSIEATLASTFDLSFAFNKSVFAEETLGRLNIGQAELADPEFSFLKKLGFSATEIEQSNEVICGTQTLEGAPYLKKEHYPVFDCANKCGPKGTRFLQPMSHVKMMAAVQPFISGAISKTVNMPSDATVEDVKEIYFQSWKMGLKALAIYRDGSKMSQPLNVKQADPQAEKKEMPVQAQKLNLPPRRKRLPDERQSITHRFLIAGHKGYITVGLYENGQPGEIFITMAKQGSLISGLVDSLATTVSIALQYGVPLAALINKFINARFEPYGFTSNPQIRIAKSILDYVGRYLALKFLSPDELQALGLNPDSSAAANQAQLNLPLNGNAASGQIGKSPESSETDKTTASPTTNQLTIENANEPVAVEATVASDAPVCQNCGSLMRMKTGSCYTCQNCGNTSGGC